MNQTTDAGAVFAPLWARKWLILLVGILVAVGTYFYYKNESTIYSVTAQLYLGGKSEEQGLLNEKGSGKASASSGNLTNQAALINSSLINEAVRKKLRAERGNPIAKVALRGKAKAKSNEKAPFITITVEARTPKGASLLANTIAQTYITRERANYVRAVESVITITHRQLRRLEAEQIAASKGKHSSSVGAVQVAELSTKINSLESELSVSGVQQIGKARPTAARLVSPHPRKNVVFGFVLGVLLASIGAYTLSRFDRRLRSLAHIEAITSAQILTAVPEVKNPGTTKDGVPATSRSVLEPMRRLHSALEVAGRGGSPSPPRSILILSADAGDGKSTAAANLALVQRDAGRRVALIEANFRRPVQAKLLGLAAERGLGDVLSGTAVQDQAMQMVAAAPATSSTENGHRPAGSDGSVSVLIGGGDVANPPALLAAPAMAALLQSLTGEFDYVLIDVPSPLEVSDALPLLSMVDGILIVTRVDHTREVSARRLTELIERSASAPVLGVVANGASRADIERYGFSTMSAPKGRRRLALSGR